MNMENYIIECPLAEVFINDVSQGFHNEYTCRNLQLAVRRGELKNVKIVFKYNIVENGNNINKEIVTNIDERGNLSEHLVGMYDIMLNLKFELLKYNTKKVKSYEK